MARARLDLADVQGNILRPFGFPLAVYVFLQVHDRVGAAASLADTLVELGYDALDWRPVLRQIRTRLIGEMSGYGGPNITTRAGTRKV